MVNHINWMALANVDPEFIDAILIKERIERKKQHVEIMAQRAVKIAVPVHHTDQPVAPTANSSH